MGGSFTKEIEMSKNYNFNLIENDGHGSGKWDELDLHAIIHVMLGVIV